MGSDIYVPSTKLSNYMTRLEVSPNLVSRWRKVYSFWGMYVYEDRKFKISEALPCWLSQPSSHLDTKSLKKNPEF